MKTKTIVKTILILLLSSRSLAQIDLNFPVIKAPDSTALRNNDNPIIKTSLNGIITASGFYQDGTFGMGDGAITMWANPIQPKEKQNQFGGDLRKTWIILKATAFNLPDNWTATGRVELDFLGGMAGQGGFADENPTPRLRIGYVELYKNSTRIRIGQAWTPMVANFPVSVTHFAMGYGAAGGIGFRNPGLFLYQNLNRKNANTKWRLDAAVFRGSWTGGAGEPGGRDAGEIGIPQSEVGLFLENNTKKIKWEINAVAHYDEKEIYNVATETYSTLRGRAVQIGTKVTYEKFSLQANSYWGQAIAQSWGNLLQFGDIQGNGAWGQIGYKFNKRLSTWFMYGYDNPNDRDVVEAIQGNSRLKNQIYVPMIKYDLGPLSLALEWFRAETKWNVVSNGMTTIKNTSANQLALGANFIF
ncbi:hypothetical protein [Flavobacterium sedimenticola]|uniref:Porin n=1 Tax=Flavobacterium sedimenticola TaxID=3043286 RepID=A0ABT6XU72_9FLAO|nr:hypothetical protein [Flavobacterium sedimenticola]MDI9258169.1 hypothetical protein [Flavobacterium sedimenticola]